jgi:hypothetical protein
MRKISAIWRRNLRLSKSVWGPMTPMARESLRELTAKFNLSVAAGDLQFLENRWYVTHAALLKIAQRRRCSGIETALNERLSDPSTARWVFKATVFTNASCKGFVGHGDADPSTLASAMHGAEMRIAETRAVNRALRKAYGIGICSVEELGSTSPAKPKGEKAPVHLSPQDGNGASNGQPRLRDRLCLLIREHRLDSALVKSYAADFCGTANLAAASRDSGESFISHLSSAAKENRDGLICKLNSYAQPVEANP